MDINIILSIVSSFGLVFAAEFADKSQLVCMTLAARYRPWPVFFGAILAFSLLNLIAVIFGAAAANWLPPYITSAIVTGLFLLFGLQALRQSPEDNEQLQSIKSSRSIFLTTFSLIVLAEFGDKTQLAVVALASTFNQVAIFIGATVALATTTALGILIGQQLLKRISLKRLQQISGTIFILMGLFSAWQTLQFFHAS